MSDRQSYAGVSWSWEAAKADRDRNTPVYFVEGAGLIKIGYASNPLERFASMLTGCPVPLSLLASNPGGPTLENQLHKQFAEDRTHGEWFRKTAELMALIATAHTQYGPEYHNRVASLARKVGETTRLRAPRMTASGRARKGRYDWSPANPQSLDRPPLKDPPHG